MRAHERVDEPAALTVRGTLRVGERRAQWVRDGVLDGRPVILLAHGAGAPLTSDFMQLASDGLVARDLVVARFHFPYMQLQVDEQRRRPPNGKAVLRLTWEAMLDKAAAWKGGGALVLAGKSMGGRIASMLLASDEVPHRARIQACVYLGYPLHPPGQPGRLRADHLPAVGVPQLFVSGTRDSLCDLKRLRPVLKGIRHPSATLHLVAGGDHSLSVRKQDGGSDPDAWLDVVADFVHRGSGQGPA